MTFRCSRFALLFPLVFLPALSRADDLLREGSLDSFRAVEGWRMVAEAAAVPGLGELALGGEGRILVNGATMVERAPYLLTRREFGDVNIELEFMIPQDSNAGVYVMGRYEVQILDSFGKAPPSFDHLGGIYQRWDDSRPAGQEGFDGVAPRTNAARAPGEWQTLDITFRAPRFDAAGKKVRDATFERVLVNGELVQKAVATSGPTRSAPLEGEASQGPVAIQGDHGPIAIRRFRVTSLEEADQTRLRELDAYWSEVSRAVKEGDFDAYAASCHRDGVLVSGRTCTSEPLAAALARWRQGFLDTRDGKLKASVEFRFATRLGDATTAHESGIFCYRSQVEGGPPKQEYIHLEALLMKQPDGWKILMENQKGPASEAEWKALE